jgi:glucokinase
MAKSQKVVLGVDIGGTKIAAGLVNSEGKILYSSRTRMVAKKSAQEGVQAVRTAVDDVLKATAGQKVSAIGVSVPGWVDSAQGMLLSATNLPCWRNFPLAQEIETCYRLPTHLANDANAAALAEAAWGAGAGYRNVFYVTIGTGIGTALVLRHRIYPGRTGAAGEGGHMTINFRGPLCGCGKRGCIEMYASGTAIARSARERMRRAGIRSLGGRFDAKHTTITAEAVAKAAAAGDQLAGEILGEAADHFAIWLGGIVDLLEPEIIVVGGGVARLMTSMLHRIRRRLKIWAVNPRQQQIPIVNASYGPESALVGAAALCLSRAQVWNDTR